MTPIKPLYGFEILDIVRADPEISAFFKGVIAYDQLKLIQQANFPCAFILNSDSSKNKGEHWLLIFLPNNNLGIVLDSLQFPIQLYTELFLTVLKKCKIIQTAPFRVQSLNSAACGYHALFALFMLKKFNIHEIFKYIYEKGNYNLNDEIAYFCIQYFRSSM